MRKLVGVCVVAVLLWSIGAARAQENAGFQHPVMRVPKLSDAPEIDGRIGAKEWGRASAFTGVTAEGSVGGHGSLVPEIQQVQWYLGYDEEFPYLAMRSPHPEGTYPVARTKEDDLVAGHPPILFEDHVEVQILTHGRRDQATTQGKGFYKIMANPKGTKVDQYLYNGTVGTEELWSMGGPLKCHVTPDAWELEMAVELGRLGIESLDGRDLVIQLVRTDSCTGMYFAGWVGAPWLAWNRFAQVSFVPETPAFRFLELGQLGAGELDAVVELTGGDRPAEVTVDITIENVDGEVTHSASRTVDLLAGTKKKVSFRKTGIPVSKVPVADSTQRNHFEIKATAKIGGEEVVLYHNRSPFMQFDEEFKKKFLDKWIAGRPHTVEWEYRVAYLPYSQKLEASVDLDFFGMPEKVLQAWEFGVEVAPAGSDAVLGQGGAGIEDLTGGPVLIDLPELEEGNYVARFELRDGAGEMISAKEATFVRKKYAWEHNQLGVSDEVIPPFEPLRAKDGRIAMWGRTYHVGENGLPAQIRADVPTGNLGEPARLLAAPIRFEVVRNGKVTEAQDGSSMIENAAMHRVDITGRRQIGPVRTEVESFVEYDGWYEVACRVSGAAGNGSEAIDALDLVIELDDRAGVPVDTLYVQRLGDGRRGNRFSAIPAEPGVHFESTELLEYRGGRRDWKSFVPRTYVGNGDRGLWFFAWSATGWELADGQPVIRVERLEGGDVRLRVRLLAGPLQLTEPRTLRFALQAAPVKPNHPRYRTFNEEDIDAHDTRGYRYYGESVDGFVNDSESDYEALRKFVLYGQRYQDREQRTAKKNYGWWRGHYTEELGHGAKLIMYGSGQLMGMGAEEFRTFGGEWLGKSNWRPNRSAASDAGRWNYQGTEQWDTDAELSVTGVNWTQSMIDFFVHEHKPLLDHAGFNGTWWDNSSVGIVREYNEDLGRMEEVWMLYPRRQLIKRLHVLGWKLSRPPLWASNMHVDLGFAEVFWMVENDWYADGADMTSLEQWPIGQFRAMARTKSTMQVARAWLSGFHGTTPELDRRIKRSLWAMMMSHDIHPGVLTHYKMQGEQHLGIRRTMSRLRGLVNLPDTGRCLFAGYWKTGRMVHPAGETIHAGVYTNPNLRTAAVLFFNGKKQQQDLSGTELHINALIPVRGKNLTAARVFDIESGKTVATATQDGTCEIREEFPIGAHNFRLLGVEAK